MFSNICIKVSEVCIFSSSYRAKISRGSFCFFFYKNVYQANVKWSIFWAFIFCLILFFGSFYPVCSICKSTLYACKMVSCVRRVICFFSEERANIEQTQENERESQVFWSAVMGYENNMHNDDEKETSVIS